MLRRWVQTDSLGVVRHMQFCSAIDERPQVAAGIPKKASGSSRMAQRAPATPRQAQGGTGGSKKPQEAPGGPR